MTRQTALNVGDTTPAATPDIRIGRIVKLVMTAHRADPDDVDGWFTQEFDDVVGSWIHENVEATVARILNESDDRDVQQHSTRREERSIERRLADFRSDDPTEQTRLVTDGGWPVSDAVDHGDYEPLDMANNIDDERVRQRIAWIDGMGRAYAHSLDSQDTKPLADGGEIPPEEDVILNPSNGSEIAGHADHEAFSVLRFGAGDLVDIHISCGECGTRWIIEDVPKDVAENPGDYLNSEGDR